MGFFIALAKSGSTHQFADKAGVDKTAVRLTLSKGSGKAEGEMTAHGL